MSRRRRVLGGVQRLLSGTLLCKSVLVVLPVDYILKGFLLETTTERDMVYLWRVVEPLYRPMQTLSLGHSERIMADDKVYIDRNDYDSAARHVRDLIVEGEHMEYLRAIVTPRDFLYRHRPARHDLPIFSAASRLGWANFDRGLTRYLAGDEQMALEALRAMDAEIDRTGHDRLYFRDYLKRFVHEAERGSENGHRLLNAWVDENIEKFGLQKAREIPLSEA